MKCNLTPSEQTHVGSWSIYHWSSLHLAGWCNLVLVFVVFSRRPTALDPVPIVAYVFGMVYMVSAGYGLGVSFQQQRRQWKAVHHPVSGKSVGVFEWGSRGRRISRRCMAGLHVSGRHRRQCRGGGGMAGGGECLVAPPLTGEKDQAFPNFFLLMPPLC
ncbi:hypothetical protein Taro_042314, partial [Colocasia esculenta]|nr:hypothetical protein [Colocasia esculenta]